ncbi:protease SohB [Alteromonadaceae bacterium M269]|nr:protease SohB [Alteromonadaceae bacterium M269]
MEFLTTYGLFLAKAVTLVAAILIVVGGIIGMASKQKQGKGQLEISSLTEKLEELKEHALELVMDKTDLKKMRKEQKKAKKQEEKAKSKDDSEAKPKPNLFVVDFNGSTDAHEADALREEITAILMVAKEDDEVLVRLESGGGVVHGYGLAASQLQRIKDKNIKLTVSVDKVAASGGYMMACVADKVLSANFAIIGSIGVIAQLPNFNKLLKKNDIEFEQHTAGEFKRTITMFGENNDEGREKFREELEDVHVMFKEHVQTNRPNLDIEKVATGEYWYGIKAHELGLVDELSTSDDYLLASHETKQIFKVKYSTPKKLAEKLASAASLSVESTVMKLWERANRLF